MSLKEESTDGRTGMDNAEKYKKGDLSEPEDDYSSIGGPGSSSLQNRSMNKSNLRGDTSPKEE